MKKLVMMLSVLAALLVACTSGGETATISPFFGGTDGLKISFVESAPPSTPILDQSRVPFDVVLNVENAGEWDIANPSDSVFTITGVSPSDFGKTAADFSKPSNLPLNGIKKDSQGNKLPGTTTQLAFTNLAYTGKIAGSQQLTISANSCYKYGTRATSRICVRSNLLSPSVGGCTLQGAKELFVSGAPVHVEGFQESVESANRIAFTFNIVPKGTGSYYQLGSSCAEEISKKNKVKVTIDTKLATPTVCNFQDESGNAINSNSGYVTIFGQSRIVRCTQELSSSELGDYEKIIDLTLEYDNKDTIQKTITVSS